MNISKLWVMTAGVCQISHEGQTILLSLSSFTNSANERREIHVSYLSLALYWSVIGTFSLVLFFYTMTNRAFVHLSQFGCCHMFDFNFLPFHIFYWTIQYTYLLRVISAFCMKTKARINLSVTAFPSAQNLFCEHNMLILSRC